MPGSFLNLLSNGGTAWLPCWCKASNVSRTVFGLASHSCSPPARPLPSAVSSAAAAAGRLSAEPRFSLAPLSCSPAAPLPEEEEETEPGRLCPSSPGCPAACPAACAAAAGCWGTGTAIGAGAAEMAAREAAAAARLPRPPMAAGSPAPFTSGTRVGGTACVRRGLGLCRLSSGGSSGLGKPLGTRMPLTCRPPPYSAPRRGGGRSAASE